MRFRITYHGRMLLSEMLLVLALSVLACGPADQVVQERLGNVPIAQEDEPTPEPTEEPTRVPEATRCVSLPPEMQDNEELLEGQIEEDGIKYQCFVVTPTPTPKYPALGDLTQSVQREEDKQAAAREAGGAAGASAPAARIRFVKLYYSSEEAKNAAVEVIREYRKKDDSGEFWFYRDGGIIFAEIPVTMLVALSEIEGFVAVEPGEGYRPDPH